MGRVMVGVVILVCGLVMLCNVLGLTSISIGDVMGTFFWPIVFIFAGVSFLVGKPRLSTSRLLVGLILLLLGILFLGDQVHWFDVGLGDLWQYFWPTVIILFGLSILFGSHRSTGSSKRRSSDSDSSTSGDWSSKRTNQWAIFSGIQRKHETWQLKNADYWAFLGNVDLDLRTAVVPDGETILSVTAFLGSARIIVPPDLAVDCQGTTMLGSLHFFGKEHGGLFTSLSAGQGDVHTSPKVVRIDCNSFMGNIRVSTSPE
jgi:predicted membrane protein